MRWEKRTDRLDVPRQLRVGESLGKAIRRLAQREQRSIQQQMVVLIVKGIQAHCGTNHKEESKRFRQAASDFVG